jgi:hypothetical protein
MRRITLTLMRPTYLNKQINLSMRYLLLRIFLKDAARLFLLQLPFIFYFAPALGDFVNVTTIEGVYSYTSSGIGRSQTEVGSHRIFCSIGVFGPEDSCDRKGLNGSQVTVDLAQYKYLFGTGEQVLGISISTPSRMNYTYSPRWIVDTWWNNSISSAVIWASILAGLILVGRVTREKRANQKVISEP